jgi:hypothetical protein
MTNQPINYLRLVILRIFPEYRMHEVIGNPQMLKISKSYHTSRKSSKLVPFNAQFKELPGDGNTTTKTDLAVVIATNKTFSIKTELLATAVEVASHTHRVSHTNSRQKKRNNSCATAHVADHISHYL